MRSGFVLLLLLGVFTFQSSYAQKGKQLFHFFKKENKAKAADKQTVDSASSPMEASVEAAKVVPAEPVLIETSQWCSEEWFPSFEMEYLSQFEPVVSEDSAIAEPATLVAEAHVDTCNRYVPIETADGQFVPLNTKWLTSADYFAIWDTQNVDPYEFPLKDFTDSVAIQLFTDNRWSPPLKNTKINSQFGMRRWRWHHGADLDLEIGDSIYAAFDGVVRIARYNYGGYGYYVMLRHENGLETLYGHLSNILVNIGQEVRAGELIGLGGNTGRSTGPHLHYEIRYKGHAFDPTRLYDFNTDTLLTDSFVLTPDYYKVQIERSKALYHRIRSGDTLSGIAARYGTSVKRLCQLNGMSSRSVLRIGRSVRVR